MDLYTAEAMYAFVQRMVKDAKYESWAWILTEDGVDPELLRENERGASFHGKLGRYTFHDYSHQGQRAPGYLDELLILIRELLGENTPHALKALRRFAPLRVNHYGNPQHHA